MGDPTAGALHEAIASGTLPQFSFMTPDACNDMHGGDVCGMNTSQLVTAGDRWLSQWLEQIMTGEDYTSGKLTIIVTWDEGSMTNNHISTIVISPTTSRVVSSTPYTHCSSLRTMQDLLGLKQLGCAADATSMTPDFHLA